MALMTTPDNDEVWTTRDGRKIKVGDMDVTHLRNTLRLILRHRRLMHERMKEHPLTMELLKRLVKQTMRKVSEEQAAEEQRLYDDLMNDIGEDRKWGSD
jgi:hypothetical protein